MGGPISTLAPVPPVVTPSEDRVPDALAAGTPEPLRHDLMDLVGADRVRWRVSDLVAFASDASPYRLIPQAVVIAQDAGDVAKVFAYGRREGIPVTLRAGGTSLNGQAQSGGILVDVRRHFNGIRIEEDGAVARVKPGTILGHVNRALVKHGRRIGPDPASTDIATVGGVIANNSGGMRCGVVADSYSTLRSLTFVLASGTVIDTAAPDAAARFDAAEPELSAGLAAIRDDIRADEELSARIRRKFAIKNTTGYRLCAFLDADEPVEIFRRLLVGSEGTLGFVSEAVFETVEHGRHTATALIPFDSIEAAAEPVPAFVAAGASAVELMVHPTLIAAAWTLEGMPEAWKELPPDGAALLVELRSSDPDVLEELKAAAASAIEGHTPLQEARFSVDHHETETLWRAREGMQGVAGGLRPPGSALIIEDVCVPPERIAQSARDIQALLGKHGFLTGVAGHASAGNLHFLLTPNLTEPADRERYEAFMTELVDLVVDGYDGSLKAEHGTGRNMAPYVEREWGERATELMWRVRMLADPDGVLNPDVVLSRDPGVHLAHLKSAPPIEEDGRAHLCIECGFCEPVCPSRHLTVTPRQRIVMRREMARQEEGSPVQVALREQFEYDGVETCAADGSCKLACPLSIDTGKLVKALRRKEHSSRARSSAMAAVERWATVEKASRAGLRTGGAASRLVGDGPLTAASTVVRKIAGEELVPRWSGAMPRPAPERLPDTAADRATAAAVYVPACINRIFGTSRAGDDGLLGVPEALVTLSRRAGRPVWIPDDVAGTCCATPWSSKGFADAHAAMAARTAESLLRWSDDGRLPVVIDASSCAHGLGAEVPEALPDELRERFAAVTVLDSVAWAHDVLLAHLVVRAPVARAAVHPTCSSRHLRQVDQLVALAAAAAGQVVVPEHATCCGFAGDRGMLHPELTVSATRAEAAELELSGPFDACVSANRTCEIGLEQATGRPYESIVQLLERVTR